MLSGPTGTFLAATSKASTVSVTAQPLSKRYQTLSAITQSLSTYKHMEKLPLFIYVKYTRNNIEKEAHIQTRDFKGVQDAKIGDFSENWYIRPKKATNSIPYKNLSSYKKACSNALKHFDGDIKILGYYQKIDVDGVEYEKAI
jgi:hypothetical protein